MAKVKPAIDLPGYESFIPNKLYTRLLEPEGSASPKRASLSRVVHISRFRVPTDDETMDYFRTYAEQMKRGAHNPATARGDILLTLATEFLQPLYEREGESNALEHLRAHCSHHRLQTGRFYLSSLNSVLPLPAWNRLKQEILGGSAVEPLSRLEKTALNWFNVVIRLSEDGELPDASELTYLTDRSVTSSDVFSVQGIPDNYRTAGEHILLLERSLGTKKSVALVKDRSSDFLTGHLMVVLQKTYQSAIGNRTTSSNPSSRHHPGHHRDP